MPPRESSGTNLEPGIVARAAQGVRNLFGGQGGKPVLPDTKPVIKGDQEAWMAPLNPLQSSAPLDVKGRSFDYPVGFNITTNNNRLGEASYVELRNLARMCDLVTLAMETRKDQLEQGSWDWKLKGDRSGMKSKTDPRIKELRDFFAFPDKRLTTNRWVRKLMDDLLICDAPCVWIQKDRLGKPLQMRVVDTATIKPLINPDGELPLPSEGPAFQQWLKGVPAGLYKSDEMVWHPRNPRPDKLFGFSPVQQVYITVNTAIRRQLLVLAGYTDGTIPEAIVPVPENWKQNEIVEFQIYWDELLRGDYGEQRKFRFVPNGMDKAVFTKKWDDKNEYDEWLARVIMFCFSLPATPFIKQVSRANAATTQDAATDEGQVPLINYWKEFFNLLNWRFFGYTDIESVFHVEETSDELTRAQADKIRTESGHISIDELRVEDLGLEPIGQGHAVMVPGVGLVPIGEGQTGMVPTQSLDDGPGFGGDGAAGFVKLAKLRARRRYLRDRY